MALLTVLLHQMVLMPVPTDSNDWPVLLHLILNILKLQFSGAIYDAISPM